MKVENASNVALSGHFNSRASGRSSRRKGNYRLSVRLSDAELTELRAAAGSKTLSDHLRDRLFDKGRRTQRKPRRALRADTAALGQILGAIGRSRVAANVEQLARDARSGALLLDDVTARQIAEAHAEIRDIRERLIAAMGLTSTQDET